MAAHSPCTRPSLAPTPCHRYIGGSCWHECALYVAGRCLRDTAHTCPRQRMLCTCPRDRECTWPLLQRSRSPRSMCCSRIPDCTAPTPPTMTSRSMWTAEYHHCRYCHRRSTYLGIVQLHMPHTMCLHHWECGQPHTLNIWVCRGMVGACPQGRAHTCPRQRMVCTCPRGRACSWPRLQRSRSPRSSHYS